MPNVRPTAYISAAVEGIVDEATLRRIFGHLNVIPTAIYGRNGKSFLLSRLNGYNHSANHRKWVVLVDLDRDGDCAPEVLPEWLPAPAPLMSLRVAVREIEAWLLADRQRISAFLGVRPNLVPENPDLLDDPKAEMVNIARKSRRSDIRADMVPRVGSGQSVGPVYSSRLIQFVQHTDGWRPEVAATSSGSLRRSLEAIRELALQ
jgi:hypothetical protein